jgi:hypothetical protein
MTQLEEIRRKIQNEKGRNKKKKKWVEIKLYYNVSTIPGKFITDSLMIYTRKYSWLVCVFLITKIKLSK